jgi:hypothetical protein
VSGVYKLIANMVEIILKSQNAFVKGRQILDSVSLQMNVWIVESDLVS